MKWSPFPRKKAAVAAGALSKPKPFPRKKSFVSLPSPIRHEDGRITLFLSIPNKKLSPNGRSHFMEKSSETKKHRNRAKLRTLEALNGHPSPKFSGYTLAFHFATLRDRDDDNAAASCKAYRDGIADGLKVNDSTLPLLSTPTLAIDKELPRVEITLHPSAS